MAQSSAQRDPSMEEILASIRSIIEEGEESRKPAESHEDFEPTVIGPAANDASRRPIPSAPELRKYLPTVEPVKPEAFVHKPDASEEATIDAVSTSEELELDAAVDGLSLSLDDFIIDIDEVRTAEEKAADPVVGKSEPVFSEPEHEDVPTEGNAAQLEPVASSDADAKRIEPEFTQTLNTAQMPIQENREELSPSTASEVSFVPENLDVPLATAAILASGSKVATVATAPAAASAAEQAPQSPQAELKPAILSRVVERQIAASFTELNAALAASRRRSLDQIAEDILRPMLQDWLDNNLPTLVERLVREEIERVARGAA